MSTTSPSGAPIRAQPMARPPAPGPSDDRAPWAGLVVVAASTNWDATRLSDQHLAAQLTRWAPVLYVDPPLSPLSPRLDARLAPSLAEPPLRLLDERLARLTPRALPGKGKAGMVAVTQALRGRAVRRAVAALGGSVGAVLDVDIRSLRGVPSATWVYWAKDDYLAGAGLVRQGSEDIARAQREAARRADRVVAASELIAERWRVLGCEVRVLPPGCDARHFATADEVAAPADVDLPGPVAGFVGQLSERIDFRLLEAVAERGRSLLLVGPRQRSLDPARLAPLLRHPNVAWVGPKPFAQLPGYLGGVDVGLLPYTDSAFNRASFPLKILEYLAAGRAVVATDLPSVRWLATDLIEVAGAPTAFADAVDERLRAPGKGDRARRRAFAARHTWDRRAEDFAEVLGLTPAASR